MTTFAGVVAAIGEPTRHGFLPDPHTDFPLSVRFEGPPIWIAVAAVAAIALVWFVRRRARARR